MSDAPNVERRVQSVLRDLALRVLVVTIGPAVVAIFTAGGVWWAFSSHEARAAETRQRIDAHEDASGHQVELERLARVEELERDIRDELRAIRSTQAQDRAVLLCLARGGKNCAP